MMPPSGRLIGREEDLRQVQEKLQGSRCVVLHGGPGEGKSALAMTAGRILHALGKAEGGAFAVDLAGAMAEEAPRLVSYLVMPMCISILYYKYVLFSYLSSLIFIKHAAVKAFLLEFEGNTQCAHTTDL
jgi:ABC-type polar amino acid transport system ATPase subunit